MIQFINLLGTLLYILIFARVILTWLPMERSNPLVQFLYLVTEPILSPIRRVLPNMGMIDLSPMIAMILVLIIQTVLVQALA